MKKIITPFLLFFVTLCYAQNTLNNTSIISLVRAGLSPGLITTKIKTSPCAFDLSTDALIALKQAKVTDEVISAMLEKQSSAPAPTGNAAADAIIARLPQSGIYYFDAQNAAYLRLDPTLVTGNKVSMGLTGTLKSRAQLDGGEANLQAGSSPVFYFYFGKNAESKLGSTSANNSTSTGNAFTEMLQAYLPERSSQAFSPNDFKLLKLDKSKRSRTFETGKVSYYGGTSANGISRNVQNFKYEALTGSLYKVYFPTGLPAGEYCFIYASSAASGGVTASVVSINSPVQMFKTDTKVFDFSVK